MEMGILKKIDLFTRTHWFYETSQELTDEDSHCIFEEDKNEEVFLESINKELFLLNYSIEKK